MEYGKPGVIIYCCQDRTVGIRMLFEFAVNQRGSEYSAILGEGGGWHTRK